MMNRIDVRRIKTGYGYDEYYWVIDDVPVTTYLEDCKSKTLAVFGSLLGLLPAWSGRLVGPGENELVWEMVDSREELNVPILVCEDDCDLSCLVIVAHIRKTEETVCWDKIGRLDHANFVAREYERSGILCLAAYTDEDWEKYGDNIAGERYGSPQYREWVRENSDEEYLRRLRNYVKPYMQEERNIEWIGHPNWVFRAENYARATERYRKLREEARGG